MKDGVIEEMSVEENLILESYNRHPFSNGPFLDFGEIAKLCDQLIGEFEIRTPSRDFSFGNSVWWEYSEASPCSS